MLVAQRTRELALLRAIGASRRQVMAAVLGEAFVVGVVASTVGLFGAFIRAQRGHLARAPKLDSAGNFEWRDRRHTFPLLTGDAFRMLADYAADVKDEVSSMATQLLRDDTPLSTRLLPQQSLIVFLGNDDPALPAFLEGGYLDSSPRSIVLIVLNGDNDGISLDSERLAHPKLAAVFTQNCLGSLPGKVFCLPIGLENRQWSMHGWTPETIMGSMLGALGGPSALDRSLAINGTAAPLAFACFGVHTWRAEREPLSAQLDREHGSWVSRECNRGLVDYHRRMLDSAAVIAPRGHGLDTLRAWEALYLGRVVVTASKPMDPLWEDLPVLILKSWEDLSREAVESGIAALSQPAALQRSRAATQKLFVPYWACQVGKAAGREAEFCSTEALLLAFAREEGA